MLSSVRNSSSIRTAFVIGAGVAATGIGYMVYRYWGGRQVADADEGFVDETKADTQSERKVLVLGLDNGGKSTLLANLSKNDPTSVAQPTQGFKVICYQTGKVKLSFWEIGGAKSMRQYWNNFVQDTSVFVFVVDSADDDRFSEAFTALHEISGDERLKKVPIVLVANKQDVKGAKNAQQVMHALGLDNLSRLEHPVHVLSTSVVPNGSPQGVDELEKLLKKICS